MLLLTSRTCDGEQGLPDSHPPYSVRLAACPRRLAVHKHFVWPPPTRFARSSRHSSGGTKGSPWPTWTAPEELRFRVESSRQWSNTCIIITPIHTGHFRPAPRPMRPWLNRGRRLLTSWGPPPTRSSSART